MLGVGPVGHHYALRRQPLIELHYHHIADDEFLERSLSQVAFASPRHSRARCQFVQSLDRSLGTAHGIMFERVPQAEQEQEERAFGPGTQSAGTDRKSVV